MKKAWPSLSSNLFCLLKTLKMMIHGKNTSAQWFLLTQNICHNKKSWLFQLVAFKIYAVVNRSSLLFQLVVMNIYRKQSLRDVPWNQLKSDNIETLYLLSALKRPVQNDYKIACFVMEEAWTSAGIFVKNIFNPFHQKTRGILTFSRSIIVGTLLPLQAYFAVPQPTLSHSHGNSLAKPIIWRNTSWWLLPVDVHDN